MALTKADIAEHLFTQLGMNKSKFQASVTLIFVRRTSVLDVTQRRVRIFPSAPVVW